MKKNEEFQRSRRSDNRRADVRSGFPTGVQPGAHKFERCLQVIQCERLRNNRPDSQLCGPVAILRCHNTAANDDRDLPFRKDLLRRVQSVHHGHGHVQYKKIRLERSSHLQRFQTIGCNPGNAIPQALHESPEKAAD